MNTLNESQIVSLLQDTVPDLDVVARRICGQIVFVGWPHLVEARVVAVANNQVKYNIETNVFLEGISKNDIIVTKLELTTREVDDWRASERDIRNRYLFRTHLFSLILVYLHLLELSIYHFALFLK